MNAVPHEQSRVLGVAKTLVGSELDASIAYARLVVLTADAEAMSCMNGQWCFLDSLRLLCRTTGTLQVALPEGVDVAFAIRVRELCEKLWSRAGISFVSLERVPWSSATAVLNVGTTQRHDLPWTSINAGGWVARVSSGPKTISSDDCESSNGAAALLAASFGVTEVFKRVFEVPSKTAPLLDATEFSLWEMSEQPRGSGPPLPDQILLPDTVQFGAGAIGNALALCLSQLPLQGRLHIVDKQDYGLENAETCTQIELDGWVGEEKGPRLAAWLEANSQLTVTGQKAWIADAIDSPELRKLRVDLVMNGLDRSEPRHETQCLWPGVLIDGGTNQVGAAVVQHRLYHPELACLICAFELPSIDLKRAIEDATGLRLQDVDIVNQNRLITEQDIENVDPSRKEAAARNVGKPICSVMEDGDRLLQLRLTEGFQPSVPFVAAASAALMAAEMIKAVRFSERPPMHQFMLGNMFLGPKSSAELARGPRPNCRCVTFRLQIETARESRVRANAG